MPFRRISYFSVALLACILMFLGCDRSSAPPPPLALEDIPAALQKAFSKAKPEGKELVSQTVTSLQAKDYSKAFLALQALSGSSGLTKEQSSVTGRAFVSVNSALQSAQTQGDTKAAETLQTYRINK
jgi:hypothetical protein